MMTYEAALEQIKFKNTQLLNLTAERDRLKAESANASTALSSSNEANSQLLADNAELEQNIVDIVEEIYNSDIEMIGE